MSIASAYLSVGGLDIDVIYKNIKHLHIAVYPPMGRVRVAAPLRLDDDAIRLAVTQRLSWIKKQRKRLQETERQSERKMLSGESHYVWGRRLRLKVSEKSRGTTVSVAGNRLVIESSSPSANITGRALENWYRAELNEAIVPLIEKWEPKIGRKVPKYSVRKMKTKWGSCNRTTGHIWFNIELAKKNPRCLEYLVVHEMTHLIEPSHDENFTALMDKFMPNWRNIRDELNDAPLAEEDWNEGKLSV